jgi:hypothetical protein
MKYNDDTEELNDLKNDLMEWTNLIRLNDKKALDAKARFEKWMPKTSTPNLPSICGSDSGLETTVGGESNNAIKKIRSLDKLK